MSKILLTAILLLNASCASILSGTSETMYVSSNVPGTKLYFNKTELGPKGMVTVSKKRLKNSKFLAVKEGCETKVLPIETRFDRTTLLGLFIDLGIVSILIMDWGIYGSVREAEKLIYVLDPVCPAQ